MAAAAQSQSTVQDFVEDATRFWLMVAESSPSALPALTAEQEALARRLLRWLRETDRKEVQGILILLEAFEERSGYRKPS